MVTNRGAISVDLGGATVTSGAGYELAAGDTVTVDTKEADRGLFAIAASGTVRCDVIQVGA